MQDYLFEQMLVGISEFFEKQRQYPYPNILRHSMNILAYQLNTKYPKTVSGLIRLLETKTVGEWCSPEHLPNDFDSSAYLVENNRLSDIALEYLESFENEDRLVDLSHPIDLKIILDNIRFRKLRERLQEAVLKYPSQAQQEYVRLRKFIIRHPYTTLGEIEAEFEFCKFIQVQDVADLYVTAYDIDTLLKYPDENGNIHYWSCDRCGVLRVYQGSLKTIKPSICGKRCVKPKNISIHRDVLVLREGIQLRTLIPGIPELELFDWLYDIFLEYQDLSLMDEPELWPYIDAYDIRIPFKDEIWAVDFKDYTDPYRLGSAMTGFPSRGNLRWDRGFYVYSATWEQKRVDYYDIANRVSESQRGRTELRNDDSFKDLVTAKLQTLSRKK